LISSIPKTLIGILSGQLAHGESNGTIRSLLNRSQLELWPIPVWKSQNSAMARWSWDHLAIAEFWLFPFLVPIDAQDSNRYPTRSISSRRVDWHHPQLLKPITAKVTAKIRSQSMSCGPKSIDLLISSIPKTLIGILSGQLAHGESNGTIRSLLNRSQLELWPIPVWKSQNSAMARWSWDHLAIAEFWLFPFLVPIDAQDSNRYPTRSISSRRVDWHHPQLLKPITAKVTAKIRSQSMSCGPKSIDLLISSIPKTLIGILSGQLAHGESNGTIRSLLNRSQLELWPISCHVFAI